MVQGLDPIRFVKNWNRFTNTREVNWDEIAGKTSGYALRTNNNLKQLALDIGGVNYIFNGVGRSSFTTPLSDRVTTLEGTINTVGTRNIGLDLSDVTKVAIRGADGNNLSSDNNGVATFNATSTAGQLTSRDVTANQSLTLTGAHWGLDTTGDQTDYVLWVVLIENGSSEPILGVTDVYDLETALPANVVTVASTANSSGKIFATSSIGVESSLTYLCWVKADFDDTGNPGGENYWSINTGVGDVNIGQYPTFSESLVFPSTTVTFTNKTFGDDVTFNEDISLSETKRINLDNDLDSYLTSPSDDIVKLFLGAVERVAFDGANFAHFQGINFRIDPTKRFYYDGGIDTFSEENAGNEVTHTAGGTAFFRWSLPDNAVSVLSGDFRIPSGSHLYFDGGGDTSLRESSANVLTMRLAGTDRIIFASSGEMLLPNVDPPTPNYANVNSFIRGWAFLRWDGANWQLDDSYNVSSIVDTSSTVTGVNWDADFATSSYVVSLAVENAGYTAYVSSRTAGNLGITLTGAAGGGDMIHVMAIGDQ